MYDCDDLAEAASTGRLVALTGCHHGAMPVRRATAAISPGRWPRPPGCASCSGRPPLRRVVAPRHARGRSPQRPHGRGGRPAQPPGGGHQQRPLPRPGDADLSEVLAAVGGRRSLGRSDGFRPATDQRFLKPADEMARRFARYPGCGDRGRAWPRRSPSTSTWSPPGSPTSRCRVTSNRRWPSSATWSWRAPDGCTPTPRGGIDPAAASRLEHELGVIENLGFAGFFLVAWDIVRFARSQDIMCQIRGSGADSAVCRCIGLTRVDPIRLHLPFERFLSDRAGPAPRHRHRLRGRAARGGDPVLLPPLRAGAGGDGVQRHHLPGPVGAPDVGKAFGFTQAQVTA